MIDFTDIELLQLQMKETLMMHPSEHERHASITQKVENEMEKRKRETGAYTPENVIKQLEELLNDRLQ